MNNSIPDFALLQKIGLSKTAVQCYGFLVQNGPATNEEVAAALSLNRNGTYRVLNQLACIGFVRAIKPYNHNRRFHPYGVNGAINNYLEYQKQLVRPLGMRFPQEISKDLRMHIIRRHTVKKY